MSIQSVALDIIEKTFNIDLSTFVSVTFNTTIVVFLIVFVIRWLGKKELVN